MILLFATSRELGAVVEAARPGRQDPSVVPDAEQRVVAHALVSVEDAPEPKAIAREMRSFRWWLVNAPSSSALELLLFFVAQRSTAIEVREFKTQCALQPVAAPGEDKRAADAPCARLAAMQSQDPDGRMLWYSGAVRFPCERCSRGVRSFAASDLR